MYVRNARNREEVWLLDHIEAMALDAAAFRSRDYVIAIDESGNEKVGFGRIRIHRADERVCELTGIGVLEGGAARASAHMSSSASSTARATRGSRRSIRSPISHAISIGSASTGSIARSSQRRSKRDSTRNATAASPTPSRSRSPPTSSRCQKLCASGSNTPAPWGGRRRTRGDARGFRHRQRERDLQVRYQVGRQRLRAFDAQRSHVRC